MFEFRDVGMKNTLCERFYESSHMICNSCETEFGVSCKPLLAVLGTVHCAISVGESLYE